MRAAIVYRDPDKGISMVEGKVEKRYSERLGKAYYEVWPVLGDPFIIWEDTIEKITWLKSPGLSDEELEELYYDYEDEWEEDDWEDDP